MQFEVFKYTKPKDFMEAVLAEKQRLNPKFSIRAWSRQLGFQNPSILSRILKGDRNLTPQLATKISQYLGLPHEQKRYFEILSLLSNAKSIPEKQIYTDILESIKPDTNFSSLTLDQFMSIAEWYHLAILEMTNLKDFKHDAQWISNRLGKAVTPTMVNDAVRRLIRLNLLAETKDGNLRRNPKGQLKIGDETQSDAIQKFHLQMIEKALTSIKEQNLDQRDIRGMSFSLKKKDLKRAREIIQKAYQGLAKLTARGDGDETYQVNTQIFQLTQGGTS